MCAFIGLSVFAFDATLRDFIAFMAFLAFIAFAIVSQELQQKQAWDAATPPNLNCGCLCRKNGHKQTTDCNRHDAHR